MIIKQFYLYRINSNVERMPITANQYNCIVDYTEKVNYMNKSDNSDSGTKEECLCKSFLFSVWLKY